MKKNIILLLVIAAVLLFAACGNNMIYLNMVDVTLRPGESFTLDPDSLPEGFTVADCTVTLTAVYNSLYDGNVVSVDDTGTVTALQPGLQSLSCDFKHNGETYHGSCFIEVIDKLVMEENLVLLQDMSYELVATNSLGERTHMELRWESGNPSVVAIDESLYGGVEHKKRICAEAPGETTVTASLGDELQTICHVTVLGTDQLESYQYLLEHGEYETAWRMLSRFLDDQEWSETAPETLRSAYAYPVDLFLELYSGQETMLDAEGWQKLCGFGLLPSDEFAASLGRLRQLAPALKPQQAETPNDNEVISWKNAVNAEQFAALGTEMADKVIVLWTVGEPYMGAGSWVPRPMAMANAPYNTDSITRAILDDGMAAVADCGETLQLPASQFPERIEEVEYVIELKVSSVQDDTKYYYSDTGKLADDVAVYKTRVYCTLYKLTDGEWAQLYDAGYAEGEMPNSDFYETKLVAGYSPTYAQLSALVRDAENHLPS